ncbi:hypothetical protein EZV73_01685 [Acidaminobacter sp. JC074]|uniref:hypothetical protein n=1 Tax=Acidaminobacter sp. JC074 TaxID=2530199 RepID=UPI001F0D71E9|nr:hypothetical protein [Acidaminobacter sp. JC074]MCH4886256.1 hypothetical protein [Acidaminobacter sp. JC074]
MKRKIILMIFLVLILCSCKDSHEPIFLEVEEIEKVEVANGTTGVFIEIEDEETIVKIYELITKSTYIEKEETEDKGGWTIGVRIYYDGTHHWFMPDGVNNFEYEDHDFFVKLLNIILEEKDIDFVEAYVDRNKEKD